MIVAPFRPTTLAKNAQTLVSRVNSRTCDSFIGPRKALENPKYLTKTYFYQPFAAREHRQIGSWFCETESCEGNNLSGIGPHFPQDSRPLRFKKTFREWIPMYWHRTHKTSLRVKITIGELMPCTVGAWLCVWGDHVWGWGWLNVAIFRDHYWPAQSVTRLYWQQEGPMFSYSLYVVCCLYVTFLLPPERATKAGPCHLFSLFSICSFGGLPFFFVNLSLEVIFC